MAGYADKALEKYLCKVEDTAVSCSNKSWAVKFVLSVLIDIVDFILGAIASVVQYLGGAASGGILFIIGNVVFVIWEGFVILFTIGMWGSKGIVAAWELLPFDGIDGLIPTTTIVAFMDEDSPLSKERREELLKKIKKGETPELEE